MFGPEGLTPLGRKALYSVGFFVIALVGVIGVSPDVNLEGWVEVVVQTVGAASLVVAAIKTKRVDFTVLYAAAAAVVAALTVVGVFADGQDSQIYDVLAQFFAAAPLLWAAMRTNTTVATGQPIAEVVAEEVAPGTSVERVGPAIHAPRHEAGQANVQWLYIAAAVVVIIVGVVMLLDRF